MNIYAKDFSNFDSLVDLSATGKARKGKRFFVDIADGQIQP
jgi:hypothetical protein